MIKSMILHVPYIAQMIPLCLTRVPPGLRILVRATIALLLLCIAFLNLILNFSNNSLLFLTLLRPMEFSIKFDTVKSGGSFVYIEGLQAIMSKKYY